MNKRTPTNGMENRTVLILPADVAELLQKLTEARKKSDPAELMATVYAHKMNIDGTAKIYLEEGYDKRQALAEVQTLVNQYGGALGLPGGQFAIWLASTLQAEASIVIEATEATIKDVAGIAAGKSFYIGVGVVLGLAGVAYVRWG